jgi:hypothetical protein
MLVMPNHRRVVPAYPAAPLGVRTSTSSPEMLLAYSSTGGEPPVVVALAGCFLVAPALLAARAEKAVLRMIATESAIFVTLDIVLSHSFVRRGAATAHPIRSTNGRVIPGATKLCFISGNFFITR